MTMGSPTCEYCGRCLSVCPSYKHFLVETMGPRSRIDLARAVESRELVPGPRYEQSIKTCLQCLACTEICGKGVDGAQIILDARLALRSAHKSSGSRLERFFVSTLLTNRPLLKKCLAGLRWAQKLFPLDRKGSVRHLPDAFSGFAGKRSLPQLSVKSLDLLLPEHVYPKAGFSAGEVALFTGCFGSLVDVNASLSLVSSLQRLGFTVHIPRGQSCCGAPAQLSGFGEAFEKAQAHNARIFSEYKGIPVLTQCATCHRTLSREYAGSGQEFSRSVSDAALFLREHGCGNACDVAERRVPFLEDRIYSEASPLRVAIHDPCHLRLTPDAGRALRALLSAKPWIAITDLKDPGTCCGGGGVSSLKNAAIADELGEARARAVLESGADIVVSQCPGCVLQLNNHLSRLNAKQRARHALELVAL